VGRYVEIGCGVEMATDVCEDLRWWNIGKF
jgi:hypothetical protein